MSKDNRYSRYGGGQWRGVHPKDVVISIVNDPIQSIMAGIIGSILMILLVLGSICIWPYFFSRAFVEGQFIASSPFGKMLIASGIAAGVGVAATVYLCWFFEWKKEDKFSLLRIWLIIYVVEMVVNFTLMPVLGVNMLAASGTDIWIHILNLLFHGMLGVMMALVPSFLSAVLGYLVNVIWYLTHRHLL